MTAGEAEAFKVFEAEGWSAQAGAYGGLTGAITCRVLDVTTGPGYHRTSDGVLELPVAAKLASGAKR